MSEAAQGRLQRPPDFTGGRLQTFRQVVVRHGLPGLVLAVLCLLHPDLRGLFANSITAALAQPVTYLLSGAIIVASLCIFSWWRNQQMNLHQLLWVLYLGALSLWEEWLFRVALPYGLAESVMPLMPAIIISNLVFGAMHYFTLRWRWHWCVIAVLGGMALSRHMHMHGDLLMLAAFHWLGTFANTPRPPDSRPSTRQRP